MVKQTRHAATEIAKSLKLTSIQNAYDANNEEILEDEPPHVDLLQSYIQTAQVASSSQADPENIFKSLVAVTWKQDIAGKGLAKGQEHDPTTAQASSTRIEDPAHSSAA